MPVPNIKDVGAAYIIKALYEQIKADPTILKYCPQDNIFPSWQANYPDQKYIIAIEPGAETFDGYANGLLAKVGLVIQIFGRMVDDNDSPGAVWWDYDSAEEDPGLLRFMRDIKRAIDKDITLGASRTGSSRSTRRSASTVVLNASTRYLTVLLNDSRTPPSGYDAVDCGQGTLTWAQVATNIQTSLRALGNSANTYDTATCTYDSDKEQLVISSSRSGARSSVQVTAGASNSALVALGFDEAIEERGRDVKVATYNEIRYDSRTFPVRVGILIVKIEFEDWIRD
jgi:hypothetical protein